MYFFTAGRTVSEFAITLHPIEKEFLSQMLSSILKNDNKMAACPSLYNLTFSISHFILRLWKKNYYFKKFERKFDATLPQKNSKNQGCDQ